MCVRACLRLSTLDTLTISRPARATCDRARGGRRLVLCQPIAIDDIHEARNPSTTTAAVVIAVNLLTTTRRKNFVAHITGTVLIGAFKGRHRNKRPACFTARIAAIESRASPLRRKQRLTAFARARRIDLETTWCGSGDRDVIERRPAGL